MYLSHLFSPLTLKQYKLNSTDPASTQTLQKNDVVKIHLGAHIDGFASIAAETIIVGATAENPATGRQADVLKAAWHAAEVAMRYVKAGNKNWAVTDAVAKTVSAWNCKPVEGSLHLNFKSIAQTIYV